MRRSGKAKGNPRHRPGQNIENVRSRRSPAKARVLRAFADLIGSKQYDAISVGEIIRRAEISRSTFYEHFGGKHDLLTQSIAGPFSMLADGAISASQSKLVPLLEHFWSNRRFARGVLTGTVRQRAVIVLVVEVDVILKRRAAQVKASYRLPRRLMAWQLAESMLGLITAWLNGEAHCAANELADGLSRSSSAVLETMNFSRGR